MYVRKSHGLEQRIGFADLTFFEPKIKLGQISTVFPNITRVVFRNGNDGNVPHKDNCCAFCRFIKLGVRQNNTASNGMEMIFTLSGDLRNMEFDIVRTVRASVWQRTSGVWTRLVRQGMGTPDDRNNNDECLVPRKNRIFVVDAP